MTKNGLIREIGRVTDDMNRTAARARKHRVTDDRWVTLNVEVTRLANKRVDLVEQALVRGADSARIRAITYREVPLDLRVR